MQFSFHCLPRISNRRYPCLSVCHADATGPTSYTNPGLQTGFRTGGMRLSRPFRLQPGMRLPDGP